MFSGFSAKTRISVNGFLHADPAVRARTHPARASVQRPLLVTEHQLIQYRLPMVDTIMLYLL